MEVYCIVNRTVKLETPTQKVLLSAPLAYNNSRAHSMQITVVDDDGLPEDLTGVGATGNFLKSDGTTVTPITCTITENVVRAILPPSCYVTPGRFSFTLDLTKSNTTRTALWVDGYVDRNVSGTIVDPGTPVTNYSTIISNANAAATAATNAASAANTAAAAAQSVADSVEEDISDLKSAISNVSHLIYGTTPLTMTVGIYGNNGYVTTSKWAYTQIIESGAYILTPPSGYRYQVYKYVSDSSGTAIISSANTVQQFFSNGGFIISVGRSDNTNLSSTDIATITSQFSVVRKDVDVPNITGNVIDLEKTTMEYPLGTGERVLNPDDFSTLYKMSNADGTTSRIRITLPSSISPSGIYQFTIKVFIPDATKVTSLTLYLYGTSFERPASSLVNGWNELHYYTFQGDVSTWGNITRVQITAAGTAGHVWYLSEVSYKRASAAWMLFIEDGGYSTFFENAYPDLAALGVPVTVAYDCGTPGKDFGARGSQITVEELVNYYKQGFVELSYHGWDTASPNSSMTAAEIRAETAKCLYMLQSNGLLPCHPWRAAHIQNTAPNAMAQKGQVEALATWNSSAGGYNVFPFLNMWNVDRKALHGKSNSDIDTIFDILQKTHCGIVLYMHGVSSLSDNDVTQSAWDYFAGKLETAVTGEWLVGVTFNDLANGKMT